MGIKSMQLNNNQDVCLDYDEKLSKKNIKKILTDNIGSERIEFFDITAHQRVVTAKIKIEEHIYYIMLTNITFMGGKEGQHRKDLKRVQYSEKWRKYYKKYNNNDTKVLWMGIYSYKKTIAFVSFSPDTYIKNFEKKHNKRKITNCSAHVYLNDIYKGITNGQFSKIDKNGNEITCIRSDRLINFLRCEKNEEDPIIKYINKFNHHLKWNTEICAKEAITFMYSLKNKYENDEKNYKNWKQNMWNGWYIEGLYSDFCANNPSENVIYIDTTLKKEEVEDVKKYDLDLLLNDRKIKFLGDLKASSISKTGNITSKHCILNDEEHIYDALNEFGKVWFILYLHKHKIGKTNDYEMVKWRNYFIKEKGEWDKGKFDELSAKNTPYSIEFTEMVIIELNDVTVSKYFDVKKQPGKNSNKKERKRKYVFNKKYISEMEKYKALLKMSKDDGLIVYRYKPK